MNKGKNLFHKCNVSETFIRANRNLFEFIDHPEPFNNSLRSLLVDSILEDLEISLEVRNRFFKHQIFNKKQILNNKILNNQLINNFSTKSIKGLSLLINEGYFKESFILHDQTSNRNFMLIMNNFKREKTKYRKDIVDFLKATISEFPGSINFDARSYLQENSASI